TCALPIFGEGGEGRAEPAAVGHVPLRGGDHPHHGLVAGAVGQRDPHPGAGQRGPAAHRRNRVSTTSSRASASCSMKRSFIGGGASIGNQRAAVFSPSAGNGTAAPSASHRKHRSRYCARSPFG